MKLKAKPVEETAIVDRGVVESISHEALVYAEKFFGYEVCLNRQKGYLIFIRCENKPISILVSVAAFFIICIKNCCCFFL